MTATIPPLRELKQGSYSDQCQVFTHLFEKCNTLNDVLAKALSSTDSTYFQWILNVRSLLQEMVQRNPNDPQLKAVIAAHPRLGEKKQNLSVHSAAEQKSLAGSSQDPPEIAEQLSNLNRKYEQTFPGLRYVVFVNGRPRSQIIANMKERIARNDFVAEELEAVDAMCDIAIDRLAKFEVLP